MSDKSLLWLSLAIGVASLVINIKIAMALQKVSDDANKVVSDLKSSPLGNVLVDLGWQ